MRMTIRVSIDHRCRFATTLMTEAGGLARKRIIHQSIISQRPPPALFMGGAAQLIHRYSFWFMVGVVQVYNAGEVATMFSNTQTSLLSISHCYSQRTRITYHILQKCRPKLLSSCSAPQVGQRFHLVRGRLTIKLLSRLPRGNRPRSSPRSPQREHVRNHHDRAGRRQGEEAGVFRLKDCHRLVQERPCSTDARGREGPRRVQHRKSPRHLVSESDAHSFSDLHRVRQMIQHLSKLSWPG